MFISILWILFRFQWIEKSAIAVPTLSESSYNVVMMKKTCLFFDICRITNEADCSLFLPLTLIEKVEDIFSTVKLNYFYLGSIECFADIF